MNRWKTKPTNNRQTNKQKLKKSAVPLRVLNFGKIRADNIGINIEKDSGSFEIAPHSEASGYPNITCSPENFAWKNLHGSANSTTPFFLILKSMFGIHHKNHHWFGFVFHKNGRKKALKFCLPRAAAAACVLPLFPVRCTSQKAAVLLGGPMDSADPSWDVPVER